MVEVLVEENFAHIRTGDIKSLLDLLDGLQVKAEPTAPRYVDEGDAWTINLHWLQEGPVSADTEAGLRERWAEIQGHFAIGGMPSPACLEVHAPDGTLLLSFHA